MDFSRIQHRHCIHWLLTLGGVNTRPRIHHRRIVCIYPLSIRGETQPHPPLSPPAKLTPERIAAAITASALATCTGAFAPSHTQPPHSFTWHSRVPLRLLALQRHSTTPPSISAGAISACISPVNHRWTQSGHASSTLGGLSYDTTATITPINATHGREHLTRSLLTMEEEQALRLHSTGQGPGMWKAGLAE